LDIRLKLQNLSSPAGEFFQSTPRPLFQTKVFQIPFCRARALVPQDGLDGRYLIPQLVKSGCGKMSDAVEAESFYPCSVAEASHELEPFQERFSIILSTELSVVKAKENVRCSFDWSVFPPPKQLFSQLFGHGDRLWLLSILLTFDYLSDKRLNRGDILCTWRRPFRTHLRFAIIWRLYARGFPASPMEGAVEFKSPTNGL